MAILDISKSYQIVIILAKNLTMAFASSLTFLYTVNKQYIFNERQIFCTTYTVNCTQDVMWSQCASLSILF